MTAPFEHANEVRRALSSIVSDPSLGPDSLDNSQTAANLLRDLLPDAPRETSLLLAAISAGAPAMLREHIGQGMDGGTAISLTAATLASRTAFAPRACQWVAAELAVALTLVPAAPTPVHLATDVGPDSSGPPAHYPTVTAGVLAQHGQHTSVPGSLRSEPASSRHRPRAGRAALLSAIGLVLAAAVGGGLYLHPTPPASRGHHRSESGPRHPGTIATPIAVVEAYIAAINQRNWAGAWALGGKNLGQSYSQLIAGYTHTSYVQITSITSTGQAVTVFTQATETNGATQRYRLSYLVSNGTITAGQSTLVSG